MGTYAAQQLRPCDRQSQGDAATERVADQMDGCKFQLLDQRSEVGKIIV
jgi:hypothetical protein